MLSTGILARALIAAAACLLGACSIKPSVRDVTFLSAYDIAQQIRCETRRAIITAAVEFLTVPTPLIAVDAESRRIGEYVRDTGDYTLLRPAAFSGRVRQIVELFFKSGVAYNFNLEMTENNDINSDVNFLRGLTGEVVTLGLSARLNRQRKNTRTFTITDDFEGLVHKMDWSKLCTGHVGPNYLYPISGGIGMADMVRSFTSLSLLANLATPGDKPGTPPSLVDELDFQTEIGGSVTPKVTITPLGKSLTLTDAFITPSVTRKDIHKVIVGLALASDLTAARLQAARSVTLDLISASGSPPGLAAAGAVNQYLLQNPTLTLRVRP